MQHQQHFTPSRNGRREVPHRSTSLHPNTLPTGKLPAHSYARAAQQLAERPLKPSRGIYYPVPHLNSHPKGWRFQRYIKRKKLRESNRRYIAVDRLSTKWAMLPMALGTMAIVVVLTSILVGIVAVFSATQQRYSQQVTTLAD